MSAVSIDKVRAYFARYGMEGRIIEFDVSSATVELAARALGVPGARICKTLSFLMDDACVLVLAAGDVKIDNGKYKRFFGTKARMLPHDEVARRTGHDIGGVCPFAVADGVRVYADVSLTRFHTVFPAAGSANSAIELRPDELFRHAGALAWIDVCGAGTEPPDPPFIETLFDDVKALTDGVITLKLDRAVPADERKGFVPAYHFYITDAKTGRRMGACDLRVGYARGLHYGGHIGYGVDEAHRGHHYAERACRLLLPLAKRHKMPYVIISCRPDNLPSRRTLERLGGTLVEIAALPRDSELYRDGARQECIFRFDL